MKNPIVIPGHPGAENGLPQDASAGGAGATRLGGVCGAAVVAFHLLFLGCAVPVHQQRLVSKPSMQFSDSPVYNYQSRLVAQIEPGAASSGGAQSAGCTSCR